MAAADLGSFHVDCRIKPQQIALLQSMRVSTDDRLLNSLANAAQPWQVITAPDRYHQRQQIHSGHTNWLINQNLLRLSHDCP